MKFVTIIFSIYVLALNIIPCEDTIVVSNDVEVAITQLEIDHHEHQEVDMCSPFCICQCCQINITQFQFYSVQFYLENITTQDFFYLNKSEKDFLNSILQPPRT
ncbi:DUF6660 family protein [Bizionia sp. KMM 8389]